MVFRVEKNKNYTAMSNYHLRDKNLSLKSTGLLSKILSLPDDWDYSEMGLAAICKDGRSAIRSCLKELEECGYIKRKRIRDTQGRLLNVEYIIYEVPMFDFPTLDNPTLEKPTLEKPTLENHTQLNTNILNTEESNTKELNTKVRSTTTKRFVKPTVEDIQNYCSEKGYKIDAQYFIDYYESKGWLIGKAPMKDWKAAIRNWARREYKNENKKEEVKKSWWEDTEQDPDSVWNL